MFHRRSFFFIGKCFIGEKYELPKGGGRAQKEVLPAKTVDGRRKQLGQVRGQARQEGEGDERAGG